MRCNARNRFYGQRILFVMLLVTSLSLLFSSITDAAYEFETRTGQTVSIEEIKDADEIDVEKSREILADSFISEYKKYCVPSEIDSTLKCWYKKDGPASVEEYYHNYFIEELTEFKKGQLHWVEAKIDGKLVGWATFEEESSVQGKSLYMNLLIVSPTMQKQGIGEHLVFSLKSLTVCADSNAIHLLLRKKNQGGRVFYTKLGFEHDHSYSRPDNFVDTSLLEPWSLRF